MVVPLSTFLRLIFVFVLRFLKAFRSRFVRLSRGLTNVASESSDFTSSKYLFRATYCVIGGSQFVLT